MEYILKFISENPILISSLFAITNILWIVFSFYQKHKNDQKLIDYKSDKDKELEILKYNFNVDLERKKKNFGIKQDVYTDFFNKLDKFNTKANIDVQNKINQLLRNFLAEFIVASEQNNSEEIAKVTNNFQKNIQDLFSYLSEDLNILNNECNSLKFVAPDEIRVKLNEIKITYDKIFKLSCAYVNEISQSFFNEPSQNKLTTQFQKNIQPISEKLKADMQDIETLLRADLFS